MTSRPMDGRLVVRSFFFIFLSDERTAALNQNIFQIIIFYYYLRLFIEKLTVMRRHFFGHALLKTPCIAGFPECLTWY